jgi:hypothetical protein
MMAALSQPLLALLLPLAAAAGPPGLTPRTVPVRPGSFEMGVGRTPLPLEMCDR